MLSPVAESCASAGGPLANSMVLKCFSCHFCPPSGSADFLSATANRRVKTGLKLENVHGDQSQPVVRTPTGNTTHKQYMLLTTGDVSALQSRLLHFKLTVDSRGATTEEILFLNKPCFKFSHGTTWGINGRPHGPEGESYL